MASISQARSRRNDGGSTATGSGGRLTRQDDKRLLEQYRRRPTARVREQIVERYTSVVEQVARSLSVRLPRHVDIQDLIHAGLWGLVRAIETFRPERGAEFLPFMRQRVRGAMLDELRTMDYLPRLFRWRQRQRERAVEALRAQLQRNPTDPEIADYLGISVDRLRGGFGAPTDVHRAGSRPAVGRFDEDRDPLEFVVDDSWQRPFDALAERDLIEKIRDSLQPIEWKVLQLHYLEGLSGKEVASRLRLSASRICQIHTRVLSRLKSRLASRS